MNIVVVGDKLKVLKDVQENALQTILVKGVEVEVSEVIEDIGFKLSITYDILFWNSTIGVYFEKI